MTDITLKELKVYCDLSQKVIRKKGHFYQCALALYNPQMFTLWEMETPYLTSADIFISIMQKESSMLRP